jgi:hypothetical protein
MFYSSAITAILPYLLLFGVISTYFYGISEKVKAFSFRTQESSSIKFQSNKPANGISAGNYYWEEQNTAKENEKVAKNFFSEKYTYYLNTLFHSGYRQLFFQEEVDCLTEFMGCSFSLRGPPNH